MEDTYKFYGDAADEELDVIPSKGGGRWLSLEGKKMPLSLLYVSRLRKAGMILIMSVKKLVMLKSKNF